ncbi:aminotransferase class IV family protein [Tropicibacter sp. R16_0]|uniref:aminotransferase class IV family protein n=1 Tax=Tropicibacter sp. R16_0 TaxID=2821102 RepID=UPI001AD992EE|nr:aminotransferase class IV family protein [Tropicibacter sp. R16_0]MBO9449087.1 aminotransferase class IV family protein [Tropicibacter sp. R16_0]
MESPFRQPIEPDVRLIETFGYNPGQGFVRLDRHLDRMARTAQAFGFSFDRAAALHRVSELPDNRPLRCRLTLDGQGNFDLTTGPLGPNTPLWRLAIARQRLASNDPWLRHKTTRRALYDQARKDLPDGVDELLFLNERDEVCEGTITNLFVETTEGLMTPPVSSGLLPGVLREELLASGAVQEQVLPLKSLRDAQSLFVGNSLRGLIKAELTVS